MNFFRGLTGVLGGESETPTPPSVAETIEKLLDRVQTSTLLDDRRDACRALKSLSKPYRLEVGAQGLETLISALQADREDNEIVSYVLDSLCNIITGGLEDPFESPAATDSSSGDVGIQFTEIFAKKNENIALLLDLLAEKDFKIRWPSLKLLMGLLRNKIKEIQDCVLAYPMGVSRLMDLLADSREIIRNDALLVLVLLTRTNSNIQKIVAFENAFDKVFDIITAEGYTEGGVVVEDCLLVLQNLLKNNTSNQNFFKEGSFIQKLLPFLDFIDAGPNDTGEWPSQKISNLLFFLQVVRSLVSPTNPFQVTNSAQKVMSSCGLVAKLCSLLMSTGIPSDLLTETICTVAEVVRGDHRNQEHLAGLSAPTTPPKPVLVVLLMSMVNEKQGFDLRMAVLYAFECFLYKNELGQAQIIETLLPNSPTVDPNIVTSGQLLCGGLFNNDSLTNWLVCVALSHTLIDNKTQKEQLLRVQLATDPNAMPISLMTQVCSMLQQSLKFQKRAGILVLIGTWLSQCPLAVSHFLNIPTNIPYLTSQVGLVEGDDYDLIVQGLCAFILGLCIAYNDDSVPSFTKDDLRQLITKRAGLDTFMDKLSSVSKSPFYSLAAQKPQIKFRKQEDLVYDYEFCNLVKLLEHVVGSAVKPDPEGKSVLNSEQTRLLDQYKEVIRRQDEELQSLRKQCSDLSYEVSRLRSENENLSASVQQLSDQNALMKVQQSVVNNYHPHNNMPMSYAEEGYSHQMVNDLQNRNDQLNHQIYELTGEIERLKLHHHHPGPLSSTQNEFVELKRENDYLRQEISRIQQQQQHFQPILYDPNNFAGSPSAPPMQPPPQVASTETINNPELESLRKEQEDLLLLLTDQDTKLREYKQKLRQLGHPVEEDDPVTEAYDLNGV